MIHSPTLPRTRPMSRPPSEGRGGVPGAREGAGIAGEALGKHFEKIENSKIFKNSDSIFRCGALLCPYYALSAQLLLSA